jgi:hypothetical protein
MGTLSGSVNRDRVILVHQYLHLPVFETTPDPVTGEWSISDVPDNEPFLVAYIKSGCQPEFHGPYWAVP